jgi:signal transduction histidine kinase
MFKKFSFNTKLTVLIQLITLLSLIIISIFDIFYANEHNKKSLLQESKTLSHLIGDYSVVPLTFFDQEAAKQLLKSLQEIENINQAILFDIENNLFSSYSKHQDFTIPNAISSFEFKFNDKELILFHPIVYDKQFYGTLYLNIDTTQLKKSLLNRLAGASIFSLFLMFFVFLISQKLQHYITAPILRLAKTAREVTLSNDYSLRIHTSNRDEIGLLYSDFNKMLENIDRNRNERDLAEQEAKIYQRHLEELASKLEERVQERTDALQQSLNTLQNAQSKLIESEKMASLGNLVSGVAHEVNTPLGNAVTASSLIMESATILKSELKENNLKKSTLEEQIDLLLETSHLISSNLTRAANLIKSFKKISVDQSHEDLREFYIGEYIQEVFLTFHNQLKTLPIQIDIDVQKHLLIHSYPGIIAQVISNLIQNTIFHAFDDGRSGKLQIRSKEKDGKLLIIFKDTGRGMDETLLKKVFEPFVTTKRHKGGSGLGLNIVYNLVTQKLQGNIDVVSKIDEGTTFSITMPLHLNVKNR